MRAQRIGSTVGAVFGLVFVLVNAGGFDALWALVVRLVGVAAFLATLWFGVVKAPPGTAGRPTPRAMRTYNIAVLLEVLAIFGGARVLDASGRSELVLPWIVVVVGVHFLPFAVAFEAPQFRPLAWTLIGVGVVGGILTVAVDDVASAATGVVAGFVLLGSAAVGARGSTARR